VIEFILLIQYLEVSDEVITNKTSTASGSTVPKKQLVKRDIVRKKEPINIVFCGHVDAGKSTIGGQLMYVSYVLKKTNDLM
jgi:GTPase